MTTENNFRPVLFLDTNSVHFVTIALGFSTKHSIDPLTEPWPNVKQRLKEHDVSDRVLDDYQKGFAIVRYLRARADAKADIFYSPVTRLERLCGALRGRAMLDAAKARVPYRWYSKFDEKQIQAILEHSSYTRVRREFARAEKELANAGMTFNEFKAGFEDWQAARIVLENVFVDVDDCVIYASAFLAQADEFISNDNFLAEVASSIANPGSASEGSRKQFETVRKHMAKWYADARGWPKTDVKFPKVPRWKAIKESLL